MAPDLVRRRLPVRARTAARDRPREPDDQAADRHIGATHGCAATNSDASANRNACAADRNPDASAN